ncbi:glutathione peroxidase [Sandarakinorhabdus sp.]|uniref:glutathione peroxidase n=1 Tax=Sandarakinorhabdus sp. TaxID=1916663 RepID=UPI00286EAA1B|nr:glutathione peroxidase [Sandarakinorhabdus sp.]
MDWSLHMLKHITLAAAALTALVAASPKDSGAPQSLHQFTVKTIDGKPMPMAQYKGKVVLLVNTASMCGYTPQYEGLQALHESYKAKGFTVVGVPSGDFGGQEYGSNAEVKQFCESKFGIKFPMTEKAVVKGAKAIPLYKWAANTLGETNTPQWNFHKYLIGKDGRLIAAFGSKSTPTSPEVQAAVAKALAAKA